MLTHEVVADKCLIEVLPLHLDLLGSDHLSLEFLYWNCQTFAGVHTDRVLRIDHVEIFSSAHRGSFFHLNLFGRFPDLNFVCLVSHVWRDQVHFCYHSRDLGVVITPLGPRDHIIACHVVDSLIQMIILDGLHLLTEVLFGSACLTISMFLKLRILGRFEIGWHGGIFLAKNSLNMHAIVSVVVC